MSFLLLHLPLPKSALGTWIFSIIILISTQIAGSFVVSAIFRKQFDSLTDYILYFSSFGIGYSFGEDSLRYFISGSSGIFNQGLADKLFNSVYGSTAVSAFSMGVFGVVFFLYSNRKLLQIKTAFLSQIFITLYFISTLLSCLAPLVKSFSNPHIYSWTYFIPVTSEEMTLNLSLLIVSTLLAMCVLYDFYILNTFTDALIVYDDIHRRSTDLTKIRDFYRLLKIYRNPINYIVSMHPSLRSLIGLENRLSISRSELTSYSKNALLFWTSDDKQSIIIRQYNIIIQELG